MSIVTKAIVNAEAQPQPQPWRSIKNFVTTRPSPAYCSGLTDKRERIVMLETSCSKSVRTSSPGGNAYGQEMTATCWDMDYYLRLSPMALCW